MTVRIHPPENRRDYTEMLLALLVQASIPALKDELRKKAEDAHDAHPA